MLDGLAMLMSGCAAVAAHPLSAQLKDHSVGWSVSTQPGLDFKTSYIVFVKLHLHTIGPGGLLLGIWSRLVRPVAPP